MGISAIYGDIGAGKTSLARRLWEKYASSEDHRFAMLVHPSFPSPFQLLKEIRREFGNDVPERSLVDMLDDFQEFLTEQYKQKKTVGLVVDELIKFRWSVAGGKGKLPFYESTLKAIFKYSKGLPRRICKLCNITLIRLTSADKKEANVEIITQAAKEIITLPGSCYPLCLVGLCRHSYHSI